MAPWEQPATTVVGSASVGGSNGVAAVADPRIKKTVNGYGHKYQVVRFDEPVPCVTGSRFGSGAPAVADIRFNLKDNTHHSIYRVSSWDRPAKTVTGALGPNNGAAVIADPRLGCRPRNGSYSGNAAVADPRIPGDTDRPDPPPVIISIDGTWHRPLTTFELAIIQGFPTHMPAGRPLTLAGNSDARKRERIGNAVPPGSAMGMASVVLLALLPSLVGAWVLGSTGIWVAPGRTETVAIKGRSTTPRLKAGACRELISPVVDQSKPKVPSKSIVAAI